MYLKILITNLFTCIFVVVDKCVVIDDITKMTLMLNSVVAYITLNYFIYNIFCS